MEKKHISAGLYFIAAGVGTGGFFIANTGVRSMSTSAWLSIIFGLLLCLIPCILIKFSEGRTQRGAFELLDEIPGASAAFKILLSLLFFGVTVILCAYFSDVIQTRILTDVNKNLITAGLCLVLFLSLFKQRVSVFRTAAIVCFFCAIAVLAARALITFGGETTKILPLFEGERLGGSALYATLASFGVFAAAALLTYMFAKSFPTPAIAVGFLGIALIFILIISSCIVILGAEQTAASADAMVLAMRESNLLGRGDILFFTVWTFFIISAFVSAGFAPKAVINRGMDYPWPVYFIYSALVFLLSAAAGNLKNLTDILVYLLLIGCGGMLYLLALTVFIISVLRKAKGGTK